MYKQNSKIITFLFLLIYLMDSVSLYAATDVVKERKTNINNNSVVSNVPYAFHYKKFEKNIVKLFNRKNLTSYKDMPLFLGYGLADKNEKNCYFVDLEANKNIYSDFMNVKTEFKKSYLISKYKMNYDECKSLSRKYGGYVYSPNTYMLDGTISKIYKTKDYWIGLSKNNCGSDWKNDYSLFQNFNKLISKNCDPDKLNIFSPADTNSWILSKANESHYCLLQIDSPDYLRPLKVCAPWWQIEQTYTINCVKSANSMLRFANIVVPKTLSVCVDLNGTALDKYDYEVLYNDKKNWYTHDCETYFSKKMGESCADDPLQEQCKVNECQGSVERLCELQKTFSADGVKDYQIGFFSDPSGEMKKGVTKYKITTYEYLCPPPRPSIAGCEEYISVELFPTDKCNPGGCDKYFKCINLNTKNPESCAYLKNGCERRYGTSFIVDRINKKVKYAIVKCSNGNTVKNTNINKLTQTKSRCAKYNVKHTKKIEDESCEAKQPKSKKSVIAGITESDIYMVDESCVRINNKQENLPKNRYTIKFLSKNNFKTKIEKITIAIAENNDTNETIVSKTVSLLKNGNYATSTQVGSNPATLKQISDLTGFFEKSKSIIFGSDDKLLAIKNFQEVNTSIEYGKTKIIKYNIFNSAWWQKRIFVFDEGGLQSITKPYSTLAQCLKIPMDTTSSFANHNPDYRGTSPVFGGAVIRESFESKKYSEDTLYSYDSSIISNGLYCKRNSSQSYIDWFGSNASDLYYNSYICSRLFGSNGQNWAPPPIKRTFSYSHKLFYINGTSVLQNISTRDYVQRYNTKSVCQTATNEPCTGIVDTKSRSFNAGYSISPKGDRYSYSGITSNGLSGPNYLSTFGFSYISILSATNFNPWLSSINASRDVNTTATYTKNGYVNYSYYKKWYPSSYINVSSYAYKNIVVQRYKYTCPSGYTAQNNGILTVYDPNRSSVNPDMFTINSSVVPKNNCVLNAKNSIIYTYTNYLSSVKQNGNEWCKRLTPILEKTDKKSHYAKYECSKYFGSNGTWDFQYKQYHLYLANNYKYFRKDYCGIGDFNINGILKDGSKSRIFNATSMSFLDQLKTYPNYTKTGMKLVKENAGSFKISAEKRTISGTNITGNFAFLDKTLLPLDKVFELYKLGKKIRLISLSPMSNSECSIYFKDIKKSRYKVEQSSSKGKCIIDLYYFEGTITDPLTIPKSVPFKDGVFDFTQIGYNEVLALQSYVDGEWGYINSDFTPPFKDNVVKLNDKQIYPILSLEKDFTTKATLNYIRYLTQVGYVTRSGDVDLKPETEEEIFFDSIYVDNKGTVDHKKSWFDKTDSIVVSVAVAPVTYLINIFNGKTYLTETRRRDNIYLDPKNARKDPDVYGNDKRILKFNGTYSYYTLNAFSGTKNKSDGKQWQSDIQMRLGLLFEKRLGISSSYKDILKPADSDFVAPFPGYPWYQVSSKSQTTVYKYNDLIKKDYNLIYYGATNQISLYLPYKADYDIIALDKKLNVIGKKTIYSQNYISHDESQPYQQVYFSEDSNFNLAPKINDGNTSGACRYSPVVEWGGGVSGAYYSYNDPKGYMCDKSDDAYVKEHAANYIGIKPVGANKYNIIKLQHPMPFANRVFVISLSKMQYREYLCFSKGECSIK